MIQQFLGIYARHFPHNTSDTKCEGFFFFTNQFSLGTK